jgi:uncharacterized protein YwgA
MTSTTTGPNTRANWILVALAKAGDNGLTSVQLQKVLFLLGQRREGSVGSRYYKFVPYNYGPFSKDVYSDADQLILDGAVEVDASGGRSLRIYRLTEHGKHLADSLESELPGEGTDYLAKAVPWAQSQTFSQLVRAIYEAYPDMRENSVFRQG